MRFLVAIAVLVAGCSGNSSDDVARAGPGNVVPQCTQDRTSGNAPLAALYEGDAEAIARRVADAFGDPVRGPDEHASGTAFVSARGQWRVQDGRDGVEFFGTGEAWLTLDVLARALDALGLEDLAREQHQSQTYHFQRFAGAPVAYVFSSSLPDGVSQGEGYGTFTSIDFQDLRDLSNAKADISVDAAKQAALAYAKCDPSWKDRAVQVSSASVDVARDSLVRSIALSYATPGEHCSTSGAAFMVDAVTGDVIDVEPFMCD